MFSAYRHRNRRFPHRNNTDPVLNRNCSHRHPAADSGHDGADASLDFAHKRLVFEVGNTRSGPGMITDCADKQHQGSSPRSPHLVEQSSQIQRMLSYLNVIHAWHSMPTLYNCPRDLPATPRTDPHSTA